MIAITSGANKLIKEVVSLRKARNRKKGDLIVVDGRREIDLAIKSGLEPVAVFCSEYLSGRPGKYTSPNIPEEKVFSVSKPIFEKISYKENPDGWLATFRPLRRSLKEINISDQSLVIVLENVEKPGNIGAIIRTAAAVGASGIILNNFQTDIFNPNVIRASEGEVFSQIIVELSQQETKKWLKSNNFRAYAAVTGANQDYTETDLTGRIAIIMGSEADGLSDEWHRQSDASIRIPMAGSIDSLNVSVATAVICFEVVRQRKHRA